MQCLRQDEAWGQCTFSLTSVTVPLWWFLAEDCTEGLWPVADAESSCRSQIYLHLKRKGIVSCTLVHSISWCQGHLSLPLELLQWDQLRIRKHQYWCPSSSALTVIFLCSLFCCRIIIFRDVKFFALIHLCSFLLNLNDICSLPDLLQKCCFPAWQLLALFSSCYWFCALDFMFVFFFFQFLQNLFDCLRNVKPC